MFSVNELKGILISDTILLTLTVVLLAAILYVVYSKSRGGGYGLGQGWFNRSATRTFGNPIPVEKVAPPKKSRPFMGTSVPTPTMPDMMDFTTRPTHPRDALNQGIVDPIAAPSHWEDSWKDLGNDGRRPLWTYN